MDNNQIPPNVLMELIQDPVFSRAYMETPSYMSVGDRFTMAIEICMRNRNGAHYNQQQGGAVPSTSGTANQQQVG